MSGTFSAPTTPGIDVIASILDRKYRLDDRLGEGAAGIVYRATHLGLKKVFALKLLKPGPALDPFSVGRFQREAEALGRLRHPHIVDVTDSGIDPGTGVPYLVMELLEGVPLSELCRREGPLPLDRALPILAAIAAAVDAAHERGILHRDLKPGNVLLCGEDEEEVKVLDFGLAEISTSPSPAAAGGTPEDLARTADGRLTATDDLLGTPLYVAPEVIRGGRAGRAADLYSFGVIAYEMLTGRPPFEGPIRDVLAGHLEREPPPGALPAGVWNALRDSLAKDPVLRPATAGEVVRRLRAAADHERRARWRQAEVPRRALLSALLAAAVLAAGLLFPAGLPAVERWAYDLRVRASPARPPNPKILLVTLDEASLADRPIPLTDRADEIGGTLERIFAAGARGVALDILLHDSWNTSQGFADLVLHHPETLTLAAFSNPDGNVSGTGSVAGLTTVALGPQKSASLFGFVNLDEDPDGVVRHGRLGFRDRAGGERPSWAARAAGMLSPLRAPSDRKVFWIDPRIDASGYARISWRDAPVALAKRPWIFRDHLVLVGGDVVAAGNNMHRVPHRAGRAKLISDLTLQALLVDTISSGLPVREAPKTPYLAGAALWTALAAAAVLLARRPLPLLAALLGVLLIYLILSIPIFQETGLLLPVTPPLLPALGALALAGILRRALSPIPWSQTS
jgi:CHASE2 domain-containing sensor protein/tRNA A-37 threonylcarbamoyl transferase component Bud32